jgi:catechol 2,3-dioxygenase
MDSREEVLKAADVLVENGIPIETGPHKHSIGQTFFLYCYEPGGNRFEIGAGGYLIFDPDWQPIVWGQAEREKGQAWGLQTVHTFHTYGTPPIEADSAEAH